MAIEQLLGGDLFELLYLEAYCGLGSEQTGRSATYATDFGNCEKAAEQVTIQLRSKDIIFYHT